MKHIFGLVGGVLVLILIGVVLAQIIMPSKTSDSLEVVVGSEVEQETENQTMSDFQSALKEAVNLELFRPIEGYEPYMFLEVFPGLSEKDFDGVEARTGSYVYAEGELEHVVREGELLYPKSPAVTDKGIETLLENIKQRLPKSLGIEEILIELKDESVTVACTMDVKQCEDGSYVGRTAPDCAFASCPVYSDPEPSPSPSPTPTGQVNCPTYVKGEYECIDVYEPVCGLVEVQCIKEPCEPVLKTFGNSCNACMQNNVISYTEGECRSDNVY